MRGVMRSEKTDFRQRLDTDACGSAFSWGNISFRGDDCGKFKAVIAFSFLSALVWLVAALVSLFWTRRNRSKVDTTHDRRSHV